MKGLKYYADYGPVPQPTDFTKYFVYHEGKTLFIGNSADFEAYKASGAMRGNPLTEKVIDEAALKVAR